ncbi:BQ2448_5472 [Microbotryum intermedium]|uniref:BQ2448_5472 protein n=1 Tax=Microbotryum intermedium TaxID=269621 RepID=A0A238F704_9BASI|nr:BQ2448_5472 [Microbotryum intermedium]
MDGLTPGGKKMRGVDTSLIIEGSRKRSRVLASPEPSNHSQSQSQASVPFNHSQSYTLCVLGANAHLGRSSRAHTCSCKLTPSRSRWLSGWAHAVANEPSELLDLRKRGMALYDKICSQHDPYHLDLYLMVNSALDNTRPTRPIHLDFMRLPSRTDYPDYYEVIKKPIDLITIKDRLEKLEYRSVLEIKDDFNQLFVNAKRYNAPGLSIFLDAKALHKVLKDTFASWTGEAVPLDDDDVDGDARTEGHVNQHASNSYQPSPLASSSTPTGAGGARRGPTLRPWLKRRFDELTQDVDPLGRRYSNSFWTLPDRKEWVDYYKIITSPIAFDQIRNKIEKRIYTTVAAYVQDVELLLNNALFFNQDSSSIWKDANYLQLKFLEVMKEQPPEFVPPRTYNTVKRRKEAELRAKGLSLSSSSVSMNELKYERGRGVSAGHGVSGSEPPEGIEDDAPSEDDDGDEEAERAMPPGDGRVPHHYGQPPRPLPMQVPMPVTLPPTSGHPSAFVPTAATSVGSPYPSAAAPVDSPAAMPNSAVGSPMPFNGNGVLPTFPPPLSGVSTPSVVPTSGSSADRLVAKVTGSDKPSPLSYLLLRPISSINSIPAESTPTPKPLVMIPTSTVRQHFLSLPVDTERVEITPVLPPEHLGNVPMRVYVRGTGPELRCDEILTTTTKGKKAAASTLGGPGHSVTEGRKSWNVVLGPRIAEAYGVGLGVVEVVVGEGKEGEGEVYRCFLRR